MRIGCQHFTMRHRKEATIEELFSFLGEQPFVRAGKPTRAGELADRPVASAVTLIYRLLHDLAFAQHPPEVVVGADSARHAVTISDDGNRVL